MQNLPDSRDLNGPSKADPANWPDWIRITLIVISGFWLVTIPFMFWKKMRHTVLPYVGAASGGLMALLIVIEVLSGGSSQEGAGVTTSSLTATPTATPAYTATLTPTASPTPTATPTPEPTPAPSPTPTPEPTPAPKSVWRTHTSQDDLTGARKTFILTSSSKWNDEWPYSEYPPRLVATCSTGNFELWVDWRRFVNHSFGASSGRGSFAIDGGQVQNFSWRESTDDEATFAVNPVRVARALEFGTTAVFRVWDFEDEAFTATFPIAGFEQSSRMLSCYPHSGA